MNHGLRTFFTIMLFVGSIAIIGSIVFLIVKEKKRAHMIQDEIYTLEQEKQRYEHENSALQDRIAYLQSEHSYEREAKKLNYKKPGEHVVIVRRAAKQEHVVHAQDVDEGGEAEKKAHYHVWLEYFF